MPGDCGWLDSFAWVETVTNYEAERAAYQARERAKAEAREQREYEEYQARIYDAEQAVEYAVSVLGPDRVVELARPSQDATTTEEPF